MGRGAVGAGDAQVNHALLHQMTARIVDNNRIRHAMAPQFIGGQGGALITGPSFIDPNMHRDAGIMGAINRRQRRAPVHRGQPAGITMGQHIDRALFSSSSIGLLDKSAAVPSYISTGLNIVIANFGRQTIGQLSPEILRHRQYPPTYFVQGPAQIDRSWPRRQ